jgi:pimeloyl-ACP methyl ester carboxylesterase
MTRAVLVVLFAVPLAAQTADRLDGRNVSIAQATFKGRTAVRVIAAPDAANGASYAVVKDVSFRDGTIEVDLAGQPAAGAGGGARGFIGIAFRLQSDGSYEYIYLRPTNGRADDQVRRNHSTQYSAHPDFDFARSRKESPEKYESYVDLEPGIWTKYKIEVEGRIARLYVHGAEQPSLVVSDMKHEPRAGGVALWVGPGTEGYFANLKVTPSTKAAVADPSLHRLTMVTVEGVRVPYLDWGGSGPALVFVAGLGNSAHVFDDFAPRFTDRFRVLAVTRTGYGEADQPERNGYDLRSRVAHISAALDSAKVSKAVLVGHSLGGDEITAFAAAHPDRTAAVIYLDAAMDHAATLKDIGEWGSSLPTASSITAEERATPQAFRQYLRRATGLGYPIGEVLALTVPRASGLLSDRATPRVNANIVAATAPPEFGRVRAPMLALYSDSTTRDNFPWLTPESPEYARADALFAERVRPMLLRERTRFMREAKGAQIAVFRAHHYMFLSHPDETERRMRAFLASLADR